MVVVSIVALLGAVAYPAFTSHIATGKRAECRSGLMQSMQQQERYFSQYNKYTTFAEAAAGARTKAFSGDSAAQSACLMAAVVCTAPANTSADFCIELRARPVRPDSGIGYLYVDSDGRKGCEASGTRTETNKKCWP
jgi:type IV pilus assembly protein PilE